MTVAIPVTGTTITTAWGTQVATDVNGLLARTTSLEGINAGTRLGTAESEIDVLQANAAVVGARNTHTNVPGQTVASGGALNFNTEQFRSGITTVGDFSYWDVVTSGVYAISWQSDISANNGYNILSVGGAGRHRVEVGADGEAYGSWTGYIAAGGRIRVLVTYTGGLTAYIGGQIDIFRVAQGG